MQADPNASRILVIDQAVFHGVGLSASSPGFHLEERNTDGANYYQYLASAPFTRADPLGLFGFDVAVNYAEVGFKIGSLARDLVETYAANQESDALWSEDWELPDDFHTRGDASWISDIYQSHDVNGFVDDWANPFADVAMARFPGRYLPESKVWWRGARIARGGAGHHAFFRMLTNYRENIKEVMVDLPKSVHKDYHVTVDRRIREKFPAAPSIWDPRGAKRWEPFMSNPADKARYFRELISATAEYERKLNGIRVKEGKSPIPLTSALKEAMGVK